MVPSLRRHTSQRSNDERETDSARRRHVFPFGKSGGQAAQESQPTKSDSKNGKKNCDGKGWGWQTCTTAPAAMTALLLLLIRSILFFRNPSEVENEKTHTQAQQTKENTQIERNKRRTQMQTYHLAVGKCNVLCAVLALSTWLVDH